jgi:predicted nuclease with TOPRIM domain
VFIDLMVFHLQSKYLELLDKTEHLQADKEDLQKQVEQHVKDNGEDQSNINHLTKINHELQREMAELRVSFYLFELKVCNER